MLPFRSTRHLKGCARLAVEMLEKRELLDATRVPLNDPGSGRYLGDTGGLYPNGADTRPAATETTAEALAQQIVPLDRAGNADPVNGRVVMLSIGMSNTNIEFSTFQPLANADTTKNRQVVLVNGAQGGADADAWIDPQSAASTGADGALTTAGVTGAQVQVAWIKEAEALPVHEGAFPSHAQDLQSDLEAIARNLLSRYPHVKIAYLASRTHAYTSDPTTLNPEPFAYESGFAVKWAIQDQINGTGNVNADPSKGPVVAPLLLWGPYLWATDMPRSDGFTWLSTDVRSTDLTHPSASGATKVANELLAFFKTDPTATPWFFKPTAAGQGPSVTATASALSGPPGLTVQFTASATDPSPITQYAWTYDDGDFSLSQNPTKSFLVAGTYHAHLTVSDTAGNTTLSTLIITISGNGNPPPPPPAPPAAPAAPAATAPVSSGGIFAVGADAGAAPLVQVFDARTGALRLSFFAFAPTFTGGVRVASGDINGDGTADIIAGAGPGGAPEVRVFDGRTGALIRDFFAFSSLVTTGLNVAAGDVNHDGFTDLIVAPDAGAAPEVKVFSGGTGTLLCDFFAFGPSFSGGVRVAAGDVNGDGFADIIVVPGAGGAPEVKVFSGTTGALAQDYLAFGSLFQGGLFVAAGDTNGDGQADVIIGAGSVPEVKVFSGTGQGVLRDFFAFNPIGWLGGVRVAATDINGDGRADLVFGPGSGQLAEVKAVDALSLAVLHDFVAASALLPGGVFVAGH